MIEVRVFDQPYNCRTKDLLWFSETRQAISLIEDDGKTVADIKKLSETENIFNAASASRANEIRQAITRRINAVDDEFYKTFLGQPTEIQKIMCLVLIMLTDHTFFDFMDLVVKEKLITGDLMLPDSDLFSFIHELQGRDARAAKWTDAGIRKLKVQYKAILRDAEMLTGILNDAKILRPILPGTFTDYLKDSGMGRIREILMGERS